MNGLNTSLLKRHTIYDLTLDFNHIDKQTQTEAIPVWYNPKKQSPFLAEA